MTISNLIDETQIDAPIESVGGKGNGLLKLKAIEKDLYGSGVKWVKVPPFFIVPPTANLKEIYREVSETSRALGSEFYAVRSSSPLEDVGEHSFDGIFLTELGVTRDKLVRSIHNVRKSALSDRAKRYSDEVSVPLDGKMPVIVQAMVEKAYSTGVVYSKFPCPNDIIKVIEDEGNHRTVEAFSRKPRVSWGNNNYPDVGEAVLVSKSFGGMMDHEKETEDLADLAVGIEKKFGYPVIMEFASHRDNEYNRVVDILQARKLTMLSEAEKFQVPELQEKGLVASTVDLNGVGDVTGEAFVIGHYVHPIFDRYELEAFDKTHEGDGYILVTPYLQFNQLEIDPMTPNKKATVAYNSLGLHHDYEVTRKKGLLYLSCQGCLWMAFHNATEEERNRPIETGDKVRVVSNGEKGFVFNLTRTY